jgi:hypothetical protein
MKKQNKPMNISSTCLRLCFALLLTAGVLTSCKKDLTPSSTPPSVTVSTFRNLIINGHCNVTLVVGSSNQISSTQSSIVSVILNKSLMINGSGSVTISINDLDTLSVNGTSSIVAPAALNLRHIAIIACGSSSMNLNLNASDSITMDNSGAGPYTLAGSTPKFHLYVKGLADFHGYDLLSSDCVVALAGAGMSEIYASNSLTAYIAGSGIVYYKGNPPTVNPVFLAGTGSLVKK